MTDLAPYSGNPAPLTPDEAGQLYDAFMRKLSPRTRAVYRANLERVAAFAHRHKPERFPSADPEVFTNAFMRAGPGQANLLTTEFQAWGREPVHEIDGEPRPWSPSYINNHLAAVRSLVKFFRKMGKVTWALDVEDDKVEPYRDTRGPGLDGMTAMIEAAEAQPRAEIAARDAAILLLFATMGLRRDSVVSLDLEHVDLNGRRLHVKVKRRKNRVPMTMPPSAQEALEAWLVHRGKAPGPLFLSFSFWDGKARAARRLAESSINAMVTKMAKAAGLDKAHPHGLRHAAITTVLDETGGDVRAAQRFALHENPATTMRYDDNRKDLAGAMAEKVADAIKRRRRKPRDTTSKD